MSEGWYPGKMLRQIREPSVSGAEDYRKVREMFEAIEKEFASLPEIALLGGEYFPQLLSYPVCIAKELLKYAIFALEGGDIKQLRWLYHNQHIEEEKRLLQKVLEDLNRDLEIAKSRGKI